MFSFSILAYLPVISFRFFGSRSTQNWIKLSIKNEGEVIKNVETKYLRVVKDVDK